MQYVALKCMHILETFCCLTLRCCIRKSLHMASCFHYEPHLFGQNQSLVSPYILCLSTSSFLRFLLFLSAAANQRETLKSPFHLKEEPKVEEALSPRPSSQSQSQVQPSFPASFCQDGPVGTAAATERPGPLKPREGSPMTKNSLLSQDINVKVASELLIKLSGIIFIILDTNKT